MNKNPYIQIKRLKVEGLHKFDKSFKKGLHILVGNNNSCGKSLFIKLIDFALGDDGNDLKEYGILKDCSFFYAELEVNNETLTIKRNLYIIDSTIELFYNKTIQEILTSSIIPESISYSDYQKLLFKKLTNFDYIPTISSKGKKVSIGFPHFSNLFYLNQGVAAGQLFRYSDIYFPNYLKKKVLSLFLNTNEIKKSSDEIELGNLKEQVKNSIDQLNTKRSFFNSKFNIDNYFAEIENKNNILKEIDTLKDNLNNINQEALIQIDLPVQEKDTLYFLKKRLEEINNLIFNCNTNIKQTTKILNDYSEEISKTEKNITSFNLMKKFDISICPECNKKIIKQLNNNCPLCKEKLDEEKSLNNYFDNNMKYLSYLKGALKDSVDVINNDKENVNKLIKEREELINEINIKEKKLNDFIKTNKLPILDKISELSYEISKREEKLNFINKNIEILESFKHEDERIEDLKNKIKILNNKIKEIESDLINKSREEKLLSILNNNFNSFFNNINYPSFEKANLNENFDITITNNRDGIQNLNKITSSSNRIIIRLGLFYSLLKTSLENDNINYPKLIYLDSPRDQELTWERFSNSLLSFKRLLDNSDVEGQVFITVVEDAKNVFEGEYESLNDNVFMRIEDKSNLRLLRKN
ncbi:MAG: hypothetical protein WC393_01270 [Candidatus Nanoarchaeia archaeon]|jgi:hypothetical protein